LLTTGKVFWLEFELYTCSRPLRGWKSGPRYTGRKLRPDASRGPENVSLKTYKGYLIFNLCLHAPQGYTSPQKPT